MLYILRVLLTWTRSNTLIHTRIHTLKACLLHPLSSRKLVGLTTPNDQTCFPIYDQSYKNHSLKKPLRMSSSSTTARTRAGEIIGVPPPYNCKDKIRAKLRQSNSDDNPARRFYNCARSMTAQKPCKFFSWLDDPLTPHYKVYMDGLREELQNRGDNHEVVKLKKKVEKQKALRKSERDQFEAEIGKLKTRLNIFLFSAVVFVILLGWMLY
ncbi:hypothetical protein LXL04_021642 [Taraxacum kok-saghyz]